MEFLKIRDVKSPKRNYGDAGIDFFIPEFTEEFKKDFIEKNNVEYGHFADGMAFVLEPGQDVLIPSGIKSKFGPDTALIGFNKSGVATKKKLIVGAQVIDSTYQGEIHLHLINVGTESQIIYFGEKIVQFIPIKIDENSFTVTENAENFYETVSNRADGGFGSTGVK